MKSLLTLGKYDYNILFPIISGIASFIIYLIFFMLIKPKIIEFPIILNFGSSISMCLSLFLFIIYKYENGKCKITKNLIEYKVNKKKEKRKYIKYLFILLCSLFDFLETLLINMFCKDVKINFWFFDIIFFSLFSYLLFGTKIYLHHYISIFFIILIGTTLDVLMDHYNNMLIDMHLKIIKLITEIILSFDVALTKYSMETYFISPYEFCFYLGVVQIILNSLLFLISHYIKYLSIFLMNLDGFKLKDLLLYIVFIIIKFIYNLCNLLTVKNTTECHFLIIIIFGELANYINDFMEFKKGNKSKIIIVITFLGFCLIFFMTLIFIEIFELNFFGLQLNTKKNIEKRAILEDEILGDLNESICSEGGYLINMENIDEENN